MVPSVCRTQNKVSPGRCRTPLLRRIPCSPHGSPHDLCTPKASLRGTLACVPLADRVCSRFPALRGASSRRARVTFERTSHTRKKTEGVEVSELRVDRAAVLSAGSTFAPFHLRPRIRRASGRSIGSTPPLPPDAMKAYRYDGRRIAPNHAPATICSRMHRIATSIGLPSWGQRRSTRSYSTTSHWRLSVP